MTASPPIFIAGPTAVGKSEVALCVAESLGGEIISVDSMQVYRGMDIGTAKPCLSDQQRVRHHLIDLVPVRQAFDASQFASLARDTVEDISQRGKIPVFCGGTGLYFQAYLEGLGNTPTGDAQLREELAFTPREELLEELRRCDPVMYEEIDRQNARRVARAIEVIRLSGRPWSELRTVWKRTRLATPHFFGLKRDLDALDRRIHERVDAMFEAGLVEETRRLISEGLMENITALQAIGYRQVIDHLEGRVTYEEAIIKVKARTRQYARRQLKWFNHQARLQWLPLESQTSSRETADRIIRQVESAEK